MANWAGGVLTAAGRELQAKVEGGVTLNLTKIKLGDGTESMAAVDGMVDLVSPKAVLGISSAVAEGDVCTVTGVLSATQLSSGFYCREWGLFAEDPDVGEILFMITIDSQAEWLPASTEAAEVAATYAMNVAVANAENIEVNIDPAGLVDVDMLNKWLGGADREKAYTSSTIMSMNGLPALYYLKCITPGTTAAVTPVIPANVQIGDTITDGTVVWQVIAAVTDEDLASTNLALAESTGYGIVLGCAPSISGLTVTVGAGIVHLADGTRKEIAETNITLDSADPTNPRIDLVYITSDGTVAKITGTAAASPVVPTLPSGGISVCNVAIAAGATTGTVTDSRDFALVTNKNVMTVKEGHFEKLFADDVIAKGPVVDVRAFGAKGDGVTDDTWAIKDAIAYASNNNISKVVFGSGTYYVRPQFLVGIDGKDGVYYHDCAVYVINVKNLVIDGNGATVFLDNYHEGFTPNVWVSRDVFALENCENVAIKNFIFKKENATISEYATDNKTYDENVVAVNILKNNSHITVTNNQFYYGDFLVLSDNRGNNGVNNIYVLDNYCYKVHTHSVAIYKAQKVYVKNNFFEESGRLYNNSTQPGEAVVFETVNTGVVENNTFLNQLCSVSSILLGGMAQYINIKNNLIKNASGRASVGIEVWAVSDININGNMSIINTNAANSGHVLLIEEAGDSGKDNINICDNVCYGGEYFVTDYQIQADAKNLVISNNKAYNILKFALQLPYWKNAVISNNEFVFLQSTDSVVKLGSNYMVFKNNYMDGGHIDLTVWGSDGIEISNCVFKGNGYDYSIAPIIIGDNRRLIIKDNRILDSWHMQYTFSQTTEWSFEWFDINVADIPSNVPSVAAHLNASKGDVFNYTGESKVFADKAICTAAGTPGTWAKVSLS